MSGQPEGDRGEIDTRGYNTLQFDLHPGDASGQFLRLSVNDGLGVDLLGAGSVDLSVKEWQEVKVELAHLEGAAVPGRYLSKISLAGDTKGTFYLDRMRLSLTSPLEPSEEAAWVLLRDRWGKTPGGQVVEYRTSPPMLVGQTVTINLVVVEEDFSLVVNGLDQPWTLRFIPEEPLPGQGASAVSFEFHPGLLMAGNQLSVGVNGHLLDVVADGKIDLEAAEWQQAIVTFQELGIPPGSIDQIEYLEFSGDLYGAFHLDEVLVLKGDPVTAVVESGEGTSVPIVSLGPCYPNPFNAEIAVPFALPTSGPVELVVYDILGRRVRKLADGPQSPGLHAVTWDGRDEEGRQLATGIYLCRLIQGTTIQSRKVLLLR
ncbi:FlgD immunoglobulin-like domain containing protein [Candidatus Latescibacterota bacterium]